MVRDGLSTLGTSAEFDVVASDMSEFSIEPSQTWAWLDEPLAVTVTAVDSHGNPVLDYNGDAAVQSVNDSGDTVVASAFSSGVVVIDFEYSVAGLADALQVDDGSFVGISNRLMRWLLVVMAPWLACYWVASRKLIQCLLRCQYLLSRWMLHPPLRGAVVLGSGTSTQAMESGTGTVPLSTLIAGQKKGTGRPLWWLWMNKPAPAKPQLSLGSRIMMAARGADIGVRQSLDHIAGSSKSGSVTVDITATDCTGDPSSGGVLLLQTDFGRSGPDE